MRKLILFSLVLLAVSSLLPERAEAVPVFARKYDFECTMCHSTFPRLNDFGERYRDNGYQLSGLESIESTVFDGPAPFAARTSVGYTLQQYLDVPDAQDVNHFQVAGFDLISAGRMGTNVGYMVIVPPPLPDVPGVAEQEGTVEMANVIFSNIATSWLNIRVGRFETAFNALSSKRRLTVSGYEMYDQSHPGGSPISDTQEGLEVSGYGRGGFEYAVGWVNGSASNERDDPPADFYARVEQVFGQGEGQTTGQRVGLSGYFGRARPSEPEGPQANFIRAGIDASLNIASFNLALQALWERDSGELWGTSEDADLWGGFAELSYAISTYAALLARYDGVLTPDAISRGDVHKVTAAGRWYFEDNLALHLEYSSRWEESRAGANNQMEHFGTVRLDWGF